MKSICLCLLLITNVMLAQSPQIIWQRSIGGSQRDETFKVCNTSDGNIVLIGLTASSDGDVTNHISTFTDEDVWVVKMDQSGNIIWNKCLGGNNYDEGYDIKETPDHGFIICGGTYSNDHDVSGLHGANPFGGPSDVWIVKIDSVANIQWQHCYGGTGDEYGYHITLTNDSGYIFVGETNLNNSDVQGFHGAKDIWVTKIDAQGNRQWSRCLGGTGYESAGAVIQLSDGNYLVVGSNRSGDGDVTCHYTSRGGWVIKLDSFGNILWNNCYGGSGSDACIDVLESSNSGFYILAETTSNDGDVSGLNGLYDVWVFKADSSGSIIWQKCLGSDQDEIPGGFIKTNTGELIIAGITTGAIPIYHGGTYDAYIVNLDTLGNLIWENEYGGSGDDRMVGITQTTDSNFVVVGLSTSNDGDASLNHGVEDAWIIKLGQIATNINATNILTGNFTCDFIDDRFNVRIHTNSSQRLRLILYDITGKQLFNRMINVTIGENNYNYAATLSKGLYFLSIESQERVITKKIILN